VLQSEATLSETWSLSNGRIMSETDQSGQELETQADNQEFPVYEREERPQVRRHFQLKVTRTRAVALATILVASALVIFYLGTPADHALQKRLDGANPTLNQTRIGLRLQKAPPIDKAGGPANQKAGAAQAKPNVRLAAAKSADHESVKAKTKPIAPSAEGANLSKKWSVQISAAPAKDVAETLVRQLKAKGYDGYWVQAEVKGQTYYRVRVGHFAAQDQAESVRQSLVRQEEYRDAYLTGD
jgi:cell division protein FtsN